MQNTNAMQNESVVTGSIRRQAGMATLTITLVVLLIITLMVAFAAKVGLFDLRMSSNEYRYKEAFAIADGGLDYAIQQFNTNLSSDNGNYIYDAVCTDPACASTSGPPLPGCAMDCIADPIPAPFLNNLTLTGAAAAAGQSAFSANVRPVTITVGANSMTLYEFTSAGSAADGIGSVTVSEQIAFRHVTGGKPPDVPVIASGTVDVTGNMHVVPNPNASCPAGAAGNGCAVSVWTHSSITTGSSISTCQIQGFTGGQCPNPSQDPLHTQLTNATYQGADLVQNDPYSPVGHFPPDLFEYLFGVPKTNYMSIKTGADVQATDCTGLDASSMGLIWITGACSINGGQIGSPADPVVLVVQDNTLSFSGNPVIYGIVYAFDSPDPGTATVSTGGNTEIRGSLITDGSITGGTGTFAVVWDGNVFDNLVNNANNAYRIISAIPGSWHDF